ncbi:MAG: M23 family metallopeptidase [Thermoleophilaceae bacterium]
MALLGSAPAALGAAGAPRVSGIDCLRACTKEGRPRGGSLVLLRGRNLDHVFRAIFKGGEGGLRSLRGRSRAASGGGLRVRLPWEVVSGNFILGARDGRVSTPTPISIAPIPVVSRTRCVKRCAPRRRARPGSLVRVRGVRLSDVSSAILLGRRGRSDNRRARVSDQTFSSFLMRVPRGARSGAFSARTEERSRSPRRRIKIAASVSAPVGPEGAFPIVGRHDYGGSGARFGRPRSGHSHQGQDVFARCGAPLVAARDGRVRYAGYQSAAGHYIVIAGSSPKVDYVYMHLRSAPLFKTRARVTAGTQIGEVGESGNARGCHLHFELWSSPGWYEGGKPFDPLPQLRAWDEG